MKNSREPGRKKARIRHRRANVIHDENERAPMKLGRPRSRSSFKNRDNRSKAGGKGGRIDHRFCERARERAEGEGPSDLPATVRRNNRNRILRRRLRYGGRKSALTECAHIRQRYADIGARPFVTTALVADQANSINDGDGRGMLYRGAARRTDKKPWVDNYTEVSNYG